MANTQHVTSVPTPIGRAVSAGPVVTTLGNKRVRNVKDEPPSIGERTWAQLLQLVFEVNLACPRCGNEMKIISVLTESVPVNKILTHLKENGIDARAGPFADCAA